MRAAFELTQAGDFPDVRYVKGGLPAIVDDAGVAFESEKWGSFLRGLDDANKSDFRRLLMYSRLLPDPTNLPGVLGQGFVFLFIGLKNPGLEQNKKKGIKSLSFLRCVCIIPYRMVSYTVRYHSTFYCTAAAVPYAV